MSAQGRRVSVQGRRVRKDGYMIRGLGITGVKIGRGRAKEVRMQGGTGRGG